MSYNAFKVVHLFGVVIFLGNIIVTALWKVMADRTDNPRIIAYAQRLVTLTDWIFTAGGVAFLVVGAYGMALVAGLDLRGTTWLVWGQLLLAISGLTLLWQIWSGKGFPNQFFCDLWLVGYWRGRPWLAAHWVGKKSLDVFSSRFWIG